MIKLLRKMEPIRNRRSLRDGRKQVDEHPAVYLCPPDAIHAEQHEWILIFETPRWRKFEPPHSFPDKEAAAQFCEGLI